MMKSRDRQLSLRILPDNALRQICEPVEKFDAELLDLIDEMLVLMRTLNGIGLAAPQVGITKRLFVCEIENHSITLINPSITNANGQTEMIEGCLSLPEVQVNVTRSDRLCVYGRNVKGHKTRFELTGLWARVVKHEMDHLEGILICDYGENLQTEKDKIR
jgi:peptide deformylase